jgi:UrcA family protein
MSRTIKTAVAALAFASALAPCAQAQARPDQASLNVAYADLDTASASGGKALLRRIEAAARRTCRGVTVRSPATPRDAGDCRREAVADTVRELDIASLTLAWSGRYPATRLATR